MRLSGNEGKRLARMQVDCDAGLRPEWGGEGEMLPKERKDVGSFALRQKDQTENRLGSGDLAFGKRKSPAGRGDASFLSRETIGRPTGNRGELRVVSEKTSPKEKARNLSVPPSDL